MSRDGRLARLAELLALTAFALAQPVLEVTGASPDFFVFRQPSVAQMWLLVAAVALLPPLALWALERAAGLLGPVAERTAHLAFVALLLGVLGVQVAKQTGVYGVPAAAAGVAAAAALTVVVARVGAVRQVLRYAAPAPLVFVLVFALTAPAGSLLRPAAGEARRGAAARTPPVVMVVFDEFPVRALLDERGRVDGRVFPGFARLAGAATFYPHATAVSGYTPHAVPAILTGRYPRAVVAPSYADHPDNLFTLVGDAYRVTAYETVTQLCPPSRCEAVEAGRATGLRALAADTLGVAREVVSPARPPQRQGEDLAAEITGAAPGELDVEFRFAEGKKPQPERVTRFLDGLGRGRGPSLDFLHVLLPHIPYRHLPSGRRYVQHAPWFSLGRGVPGNPNGLRNPEPHTMTIQRQRLLLQVAWVDAFVGELVGRLQAAGTWDDALVVVTADHGEGFTPGQKVRHLDRDNAADLAYVPLFVKQPGQRAGATDRRNAETVDVLPTVAEVLGVAPPAGLDGRSLLGTPRPTREKRWYDEPGKPLTIDGARWDAPARRGYGPEIARPDLGPDGLYAVKAVGRLFGKRPRRIGAGSPVVARSRHPDGWRAVDRGSGLVPALLWGDLDRPAAAGPTWFAVTVNGVVAGGVFVAEGRDRKWHFVGLVADRYFTDGRNDVRLYAIDGGTLRALAWQ